MSAAPVTARAGLRRRLSDLLVLRPGVLLLVTLLPPLAWMVVVYLGSLVNLLLYSLYGVNDFTGQVEPRLTWTNFAQVLTTPSNVDVVVRTTLMAVCVTLACALIAFPIGYLMAFHARGARKAWLYVLVLLPLWSSYLVRVYAGRLVLAQDGVISSVADALGLRGALDGLLRAPVVGGPSLASSYLGMFLVFTYIWLPYMILPVQAALERVPRSLLEASADLGARPRATLWRVVLPLAVPGLAAGSIFTFSLTLGDYIIPSVVGAPGFFIGQMVYTQQGTAGNLPLAAAFSVVPIVIVTAYLLLARRLGAFEAL
ncbi:ABC transporter permease [Deinococcus pimensis]|uniref:ABC transporter permease n=1 Tax=Deinococcus pimensis TaxID=309888 RepID=UPI00048007E0|nr:ABC transporter permease [Deinococcus pimensis]